MKAAVRGICIFVAATTSTCIKVIYTLVSSGHRGLVFNFLSNRITASLSCKAHFIGFLMCESLCIALMSVLVFLGAFTKLRKIDLLASLCPSVRLKQLGSHWTDFDET
jgi:hypothetical protein